MFRLYDVDHDKKISQDEMNNVINTLLQAFHNFKEDQSRLTITNMYNILSQFTILFSFSGGIVSQGLTLKLFEKMDLDEDGFVSEDEFVNVCLNDDAVSKLLVDNINDLVNSDESDSDSELQKPYYQVHQK